MHYHIRTVVKINNKQNNDKVNFKTHTKTSPQRRLSYRNHINSGPTLAADLPSPNQRNQIRCQLMFVSRAILSLFHRISSHKQGQTNNFNEEIFITRFTPPRPRPEKQLDQMFYFTSISLIRQCAASTSTLSRTTEVDDDVAIQSTGLLQVGDVQCSEIADARIWSRSDIEISKAACGWRSLLTYQLLTAKFGSKMSPWCWDSNLSANCLVWISSSIN